MFTMMNLEIDAESDSAIFKKIAIQFTLVIASFIGAFAFLALIASI